MTDAHATTELKRTPLYDAHVAAGGRLVPFAGYAMPVQYKDGILAEHRWTRENAGLFDVSHMGPAWLSLDAPSGDADADRAAVAEIVERLVPGDIKGLRPGQIRYSTLLNGEGGIVDDLMISRSPQRPEVLFIVVNAGGKEADFALIEQAAAGRASLMRADEGGLIALQGPKAKDVLSDLVPQAADLAFMNMIFAGYDGQRLVISRSGYTGEDGYEILAGRDYAPTLWAKLAADDRVKPIGLGARDSLRLEAGLPLYGHDIDETTSPVEASLGFALSKRRLKAGDFPGAGRIAEELQGGTARVRVGLNVIEGAPVREGAEIADGDGRIVGVVTSGGFSPSLGRPIAMAYVPPHLAGVGTRLSVIVRGKVQAIEVAALPFVPHRYVRKA